MKINKVFIGLFASTLLLCGCEKIDSDDITITNNEKTFFDITGYGVSNIEDIGVSGGLRVSSSFAYDSDDYSFLNTRFIKVDSTLQEVFNFSSTNDSGDDAIVLSITAKKKDAIEYFTMYISHKTHYLYFENDDHECYKSKNIIADKYINKLMNSNKDGEEYYLTVEGGTSVASGLPNSGYYVEGYKFMFRIEIVTDVSFYAYLNGEKLTPYIVGESLGDFDCYTFRMPSSNSTLTITSDPFFGKTDLKFDEIFYWVDNLTEENVKGIQIETAPIGVDPDSITPEVKYSEDERDIAYNLNIWKNAHLEQVSYDVDGGNYLDVTFFLKNETDYTLNTRNRYVLLPDFSRPRYFKIKDSFTDFFDIQYSSQI